MNPWGFILLALAVLIIILGIKGTYSNVETRLTGKAHSVPGVSAGTSAFFPVPASRQANIGSNTNVNTV